MSNVIGYRIAWTVTIALVLSPFVAALNGWVTTDSLKFEKLILQGKFQRVSEAQIQAAVMPMLSQGFFALPLDDVRAVISVMPWVQTVEARKVWPRILEISVVERKAAAVWNNDHLLDNAGEIFTVPDLVVDAGLPRLYGQDSEAKSIFDMHQKFSQLAQEFGVEIIGTLQSERGSWRVMTAEGAELSLGREEGFDRFNRFLLAWKKMAPVGKLLTADLRYPHGFALRWAPVDPATERAPIPAPEVQNTTEVEA